MVPVAHTLRRWLWRVNALLALGAVAVWCLALLDDPGSRPMPSLPEPREVTVSAPMGCDVPWAEVVSLCRAFHGWGEGRPAPVRTVEAPSGGRLPLAAFGVRMWTRDACGPDSILLISKDPAHLECFYPKEGEPDRGVAIERIQRRGRTMHVMVSRSEERFVYRVVDREGTAPSDARIVRIMPPRAPRADAARLAATAPSPERVDVKVLPFFGADGRVVGARVTGVRRGSAFARAGLCAGDVIVGVDDASLASVEGCRARLSRKGGVESLRIRDGAKKPRRLDIDS